MRIDGHPMCCADSGSEDKLFRLVRKCKREGTMLPMELKLVLALDVAKDSHTAVGGGDNSFLEGLFSICRMLGLRRVLYIFSVCGGV